MIKYILLVGLLTSCNTSDTTYCAECHKPILTWVNAPNYLIIPADKMDDALVLCDELDNGLIKEAAWGIYSSRLWSSER